MKQHVADDNENEFYTRKVMRVFLVLSFLTAAMIGFIEGAAPARAEEEPPATPCWTFPDVFQRGVDSADDFAWPEPRAEERPGAYWWWPGSAVTREDLTWNLETYRKAGWGNLGVIGIYGVNGEEHRFIDIFSPKWFEMFNHAVAEAERLGMNVDLTPSSGWRLGGPHVTEEHSERSFVIQKGSIKEKVRRDKVKRAGPGGQGMAINPYSQAAVAYHLEWLDERFAAGEGEAPRAFYYDSFENPGNWCPEFLDTFQKMRGYRLEEHAAALEGKGDPDEIRRVRCDYRETLSDLLLERVQAIVHWGQKRGSALRMQAHGAPANLLNMYAAAEIPETEVFGASKVDIPGYRREEKWVREDQQSDLVNRFASSAAHVAGRNLVISESFTWLRNHFHTALSHIKVESDKLFLNGINGIYYHGVCFAPKEAPWPGWLFYASTQANARNSIFRDIPALNTYITRCQGMLQEGEAHNDVLLYWPVHDLWMGGQVGKGRGPELRFSVHHTDWIEGTDCGNAGQWMIDHGYTFDFISGSQLLDATCDAGTIRTSGGNQYRTLLVPSAAFMKADTLRQILGLAETGATILVWKKLPRDVPGWFENSSRKRELDKLLAGSAIEGKGVARVGRGKVMVDESVERLLETAKIEREPMVDSRLQFIRRKTGSRVSYFIANHSAAAVDEWISLASPGRSAVLMDPMTGRTGVPPIRPTEGKTRVYLQVQPGESRILRLFPDKDITAPAWPIRKPSGDPVRIEGPWQLEFIEGGPVLPPRLEISELGCWTRSGDREAQRFAGAGRYTTTIDVGAGSADGWLLELGDVRESARVWVNDRPAGIALAHPFQVDVSGLIKSGPNKIAIEVTNLSANRVRDLDIRGVPWKKFHDINIVSQLYKPLDASKWDLKASGLLGPVALVPLMRSDPGEIREER